MRYWCYNEPIYENEKIIGNRVEVLSDKEIIDTYYPAWYSSMVKKFGKEHVDANYCQSDCIDEWVIGNWAWESTDDE